MGHDLTAANMRWNNVIKNFEIQWKALKTKRDEDTLDVPKIFKALPIIKWTEAFQHHLHRVIRVRMIPLAYVTRQDEDVLAVAPPLMAGQPHSEVHGSIEGEMIARASHTHTQCFEMTMPQYTTHLRKQLAACHMQHQLSHFRGQRMVVVHSKLSLINKLGMTSGKQKFAGKTTYSIHAYGKANQASH